MFQLKAIPRFNSFLSKTNLMSELNKKNSEVEDDRLIILMGGMGSGKTTELQRQIGIRKLYRSVLAVNTVEDIRFSSEGIVTHDGRQSDCVRVYLLHDLLELKDYVDAQVIVIDEANFYDDLYDFISDQLLNTNKVFIVAGLSGDKDQKFFGQLHLLIPLADQIHHLRSICMTCKNGTLASFTIMVPGAVSSGEQKQVGGKDIYQAVCRRHLHDHLSDSS